MFTYAATVRLAHTDAAGILFYPRLFELFQEALEECLMARGLPLRKVLRETAYILPFVHAEADYDAPLRAGDRIEVTLDVERLGEHSITLTYVVRLGDTVAARGRTVQCVIDRHTWKPALIPDEVRAVLAG